VAGLITGGKGVVDVAFELESLPTDRVNDGMAVTPEIWVFDFETANQLESFGGGMILEGSSKKIIETFNAINRFQALLDRSQRWQFRITSIPRDAAGRLSRVQGRCQQQAKQEERFFIIHTLLEKAHEAILLVIGPNFNEKWLSVQLFHLFATKPL
jgi:hypothetical protein